MKGLCVEQMKEEMNVGYSKKNSLSQLLLWHLRAEFKSNWSLQSFIQKDLLYIYFSLVGLFD